MEGKWDGEPSNDKNLETLTLHALKAIIQAKRHGLSGSANASKAFQSLCISGADFAPALLSGDPPTPLVKAQSVDGKGFELSLVLKQISIMLLIQFSANPRSFAFKSQKQYGWNTKNIIICGNLMNQAGKWSMSFHKLATVSY